MIKKGLSDLADLRKSQHRSNLEFLARFEKAAAWQGDDWTYWDFIEAPEELAALEAQALSPATVRARCDAWMAKDAAAKPPLIREIETGRPEGMAGRIREMVARGEDPNGATLLKDTALGFARHHGYEDIFDLLIELGAEGEKAGFTALHHSVRYGSLADVRARISAFDPLWTHFEARSVLAEAVSAARPEVVSALLDHIGHEDRLGHDEVAACLRLAVGTGEAKLVAPFLAQGLKVDIALDDTLQTYDVAMLKLLLDQGADVHEISDIALWTDDPLTIRDADGQPAIRAYVAALIEAGWQVDDLDEFEHAQIRYVTEAYLIPPQDRAAQGFLDPADRCAGNANPEERSLPYYLEMLRTGENPFQMRQHLPALPHGAWTADRFGQSTTRLPDGRWVQIGGEHEDFYDPDFAIFSDVVVHEPGAGARVFFYPASIFPPTDFHTATLIGDAIWVIGGLGYMSDRVEGVTLVHRLDLADFRMHRVDTTGDGPGWISRHDATLDGDVITVSGGDVHRGGGLRKNDAVFALDTRSCGWTRVG